MKTYINLDKRIYIALDSLLAHIDKAPACYQYPVVLKHEMFLRRSLFKKIKRMESERSQPQLTIPKSIAERADEMCFEELQRDGLGTFMQYFRFNEHEYMDVIFVYLNPLTRDLVEVVDDED